jgi:hypothetical protein
MLRPTCMCDGHGCMAKEPPCSPMPPTESESASDREVSGQEAEKVNRIQPAVTR